MRTDRVVITPLLLITLLLAGCSGEDRDESAPSDIEQGEVSSDEETEEILGHVNRSCTAKVELTGALKGKWSGEGDVRVTEDGLAVYSSGSEGLRVVLYSPDGELGSSANVAEGSRGFATQANDPEGLEVKANGRKASADLEVPSADGAQTVQLKAKFTCRKS